MSQEGGHHVIMVTRLTEGELKPPDNVDLVARDWETLSGISQRAPGEGCGTILSLYNSQGH